MNDNVQIKDFCLCFCFIENVVTAAQQQNVWLGISTTNLNHSILTSYNYDGQEESSNAEKVVRLLQSIAYIVLDTGTSIV